MRRKTLKWTGYVLLVLIPAALYLFSLQVLNNFHEVIPGEMYRSAQLSDGELTMYVKKYNIKSVINLRGENPTKDWYNNELVLIRQEHSSTFHTFYSTHYLNSHHYGK